MFEKIKELFADLTGDTPSDRDLTEDEFQLAAAALLVHATHIDGTIEKSETQKLHEILCARFDMTSSDATKLIREAEIKEQDSVDLFGFTSVLTRNLDQPGRQKIVEMLWEIVLADGIIHEFENNLVWRASELLGVSTQDRIRLRKEVEARANGSK